MFLKNTNIIFGITGIFNTFSKINETIKEFIKLGANIYPVMSYYSYKLNNKYVNKIEKIANQQIIYTISDVHKLLSKVNFDIMVIAPTSSNTIAKLANSISDTSVTYASRFILRNKKSIVLCIYANDGLSSNANNIGTLINKKHFFIVPFRQENPITKPYSISSDFNYIVKTTKLALKNEQIEPLLL